MNSWETMRRFEARRPKTPSDFLFNNVDIDGEDLTFEEAIRLVVAQCDEETASWRIQESDEFLSRHDIERAIADLEILKAAALEARTIYHTILHLEGSEDEAREAVITSFDESAEEWHALIAEAVRRNNYSGLSV